MNRNKLLLENKNETFILILGLVFLFIFSILVPFWFINYLELSGIGHFFSDNIIFPLFSIVILFYFILVGVYYYKINIDAYVVQVTSFRPIINFFKSKDYVDISHSMLISYTFFNRPLSFNKTLVLKIKSGNKKKIIIKRFNLTLFSEKKVNKLKNRLQRIVVKNN
jgi:hypothetical protein